MCHPASSNLAFPSVVTLLIVAILPVPGCKPPPPAGQPNAESNMLAILTAITSFAITNQGTMPPNLPALVTAGLLRQSQLTSPLGPASGNAGDYWLSTARSDINTSMYPDIEIMVYDRASYERGSVIVGFFDGSLKTMARADFQELRRRLDNATVDFNLPP